MSKLNKILSTSTHKIESAGKTHKPTIADDERAWRDSELVRTDSLIVLPDYPEDLKSYRAELRDYPQKKGFPRVKRPTPKLFGK